MWALAEKHLQAGHQSARGRAGMAGARGIDARLQESPARGRFRAAADGVRDSPPAPEVALCVTRQTGDERGYMYAAPYLPCARRAAPCAGAAREVARVRDRACSSASRSAAVIAQLALREGDV